MVLRIWWWLEGKRGGKERGGVRDWSISG